MVMAETIDALFERKNRQTQMPAPDFILGEAVVTERPSEDDPRLQAPPVSGDRTAGLAGR